MRFCYGHTKTGKLVKLAKIYTKDEHHISKNKIARDVIWVISILVGHGHKAFVVGGAVRDLLSDKIPKDFDVVTDAHPKEIKRCFNRAQIVSKRFPIVLVRTKYSTLIEVSTFRSDSDYSNEEQHPKKSKKKTVHAVLDNTEFGSIEQDVKRRDFTCNALYYDVDKETILDFVDGVQHLQEKKLVIVRAMFEEDPVRMVRAIKYSRKVGLTISSSLKKTIMKNAKLMKEVPTSRIGDEVMKILISGVSEQIIQDLFSYKLLSYMLPQLYDWYQKRKESKKKLFLALMKADTQYEEKYSRIRGLQMLIHEFILHFVQEHALPKKQDKMTAAEINQVFMATKELLYPITPPNTEVHNAVISVLSSEKLVSSHRLPRSSNPRSNRKRRS